MAFFADGALRPFTTPLDLLRFKPLPLRSRLRMGLAVRQAAAPPPRRRAVTRARRRATGSCARWARAAYAKVWGPLLRGKFGYRADDISMAWL